MLSRAFAAVSAFATESQIISQLVWVGLRKKRMLAFEVIRIDADYQPKV